MTEKKKRILHSALKLFAENGFSATSTKKVAKEAGVSEGLIFKHFGNKDKLLDAVMESVREVAYHSYAEVLSKSDPKELIHKVLQLPSKVAKDEYIIWKLIYTLKWQTDEYDHSIAAPLKVALIEAFKKIGVQNPEAEAETILILIDGMAHSIILRNPENYDEIQQAILNKYQW